ncbi:diguanylate cyclase domain-containing protein [Roseateles sp.]|uniref:diguanylate cyclase domain-containing protein n=1 Tax=Roseateles sp. TaxID=1971397 RepID=UPI003BA7DFE4
MVNHKLPFYPAPVGKPLAQDAGAPFGPPPRAALAQMGRVADMAGLSHVLSRELSAARRLGTRPAVMLMEVAVRAPLSASFTGSEQALALTDGLTERLTELLAGRLRSRVRAADVTVRVGERRLAVVLQNVERANVLAIQARLHKALSGHYELDQMSLHAVVSMGSAKCECPRVGATEMIQTAEAALHSGAADARWPGAETRRGLDLPLPPPASSGSNVLGLRGRPVF